MYQFVVSFTVRPEHREDFVQVARRTAADSLANEPGSLRFEVIADEENPDLFYLNEVYRDLDAFTAHATAYAEGPTWLMKGTLVGEPARSRS